MKDFEFITWLKRHGPALACTFGENRAAGPIRIVKITRSAHSLVLMLTLEGRNVVVKIFDPRVPSSEKSLRREVALLKALMSTHLAPELYSFSEDGGYVAMEFIRGQPIAETVDPESVLDAARDIGYWLASFAPRMPFRQEPTNWLDYLVRYESLHMEASDRNLRRFFATQPIERMSVAKNDGYLGNFLRRPDGELIGIDYECATFKPFGWDVLLTARSMTRMFPDQLESILSGLVEGWGRGTDCIDQADFKRLLTFFVIVSVSNKVDTRPN